MKDIIQKRKDRLNKQEKIYRVAEGEVEDLGKIAIKLIYKSSYPCNLWVDLFHKDAEYAVEMKIFNTKFFANRYFNKLKDKYNLTE